MYEHKWTFKKVGILIVAELKKHKVKNKTLSLKVQQSSYTIGNNTEQFEKSDFQISCLIQMILAKTVHKNIQFASELHDFKGNTKKTSSWKEYSVHNMLIVVNEPKPTEIPLDS